MTGSAGLCPFVGLNDSEGRDTEHIQNIVKNLRDYKFVNMFLIVRNGHEKRMTNTYSDMLRTFELIFGVGWVSFTL